MSGKGQERLVDLDLLRLLGIVLVVASHLIPPADTPMYHALRLLGILGVAVFFFISGYLLQRGYPSIETSPDTHLFFNRRAWRIFPLYWIALLFALLVGHMVDEAGGVIGAGDFLAHVLGLQMILYPSYITVLAFWFIGSIVVFYLLYPLLVYRNPSVGVLLLRGVAIFLLMGIVRAVAGLFGGGIFTDFPVFVLGIAAGMTDFLQSDRFRSWRLILAVAAVPAIGVAYLTLANDEAGKWGGEISLSLVLLLGSVAVYLLAGLCSIFLLREAYVYLAPQSPRVLHLIAAGATASFAVYLFHGSTFSVVTSLIGSPPAAVLAARVAIVPMLFVVCYYVQVGMDRLTAQFRRRRPKEPGG